MISTAMRVLCSILGLIAMLLEATGLIAQGPAPGTTTLREASLAPNPPLPPEPRSKVDFFREMLAQKTTERQKTLAEKPEWQRKLLATKLKEYDALNPLEREIRLRVLELTEYLRPLMKSAGTNRAELLAKVPSDYRRLVEDRLQQWDLLPPDLQREVWENEMMQRYFVRLDASTPAEREAVLSQLSAPARQNLEERWSGWRALTADQRKKMFVRVNQYLELNDREQQKVLHLVSERDRQQTQKTLDALEKLPENQRRLYLDSLRKFANLTPEARYRFLQNAERWKTMSPVEQQRWRNLATKLPPLPPGLDEPPLPPGLSRQKSDPPLPPSLAARSLATNR
jgi:hypothetical protein